jgi:rSAM/selenodomain-associated transferase 1
VDVADADVVAVLTRAPGHGGKSRLFAELRVAADPTLLSALLLDTLDGVAVPGITRVVAVEPPEACDDVRLLVSRDVDVIPQTAGDLGTRMQQLMEQLFDRGARRVVLVGSDLPDIQPAIVSRALVHLRADARLLVLGPSSDGGYYLIAAARVPAVFAEVDWGSSRVLAQTLAHAQRIGMPVVLLEPMTDVDSVAALIGVSRSRTRAWVSALQGRNDGK